MNLFRKFFGDGTAHNKSAGNFNASPKYFIITPAEINFSSYPTIQAFETRAEAEKSIEHIYRKTEVTVYLYELKDILEVKYNMLITSKKDNVAAS